MEQNNPNNTSTSSNKSLIWAGVAILVVIALAIAIPHLKKTTSAPSDATSTVAGDTSTTTTASGSSKASAGGSSWNAVMNQYNGRTVVFGDNCSGLPTDQVQGLGTKILLVNNGNAAHTVIFGNNSGITIAAHHYKTATVDASATIVISCDANQHAATITVK